MTELSQKGSYVDLAEQFHQDGFAVIDDVLTLDCVNELHTRASRNFEELMTFIHEKHLPLGIGIKEGYQEVVQRHENRFEVPYKAEIDLYVLVSCNEKIKDIATKILGPDWIIVNKSVLMSLSGAKDQAWHSDGPHVSVTSHLDCHCFNMFIPLVDITDLEGPTEFRPGSHYYTRDLTKLYMKAFMTKKLRPTVAPCLLKGSVSVFDYRVLHRGRANRAPHDRPALVLTFAKPWFKDNLNFPKASIYDPPKEPVSPEDLLCPLPPNEVQSAGESNLNNCRPYTSEDSKSSTNNTDNS